MLKLKRSMKTKSILWVADDLATQVTRSSATIILTVYYMHIFVLCGCEFQHLVMFKCWAMTWNADLSYVSLENSAYEGCKTTALYYTYPLKDILWYPSWAGHTAGPICLLISDACFQSCKQNQAKNKYISLPVLSPTPNFRVFPNVLSF